MKIQVTLTQANSEFNKSYADQYHFGKESENNRKIKWQTQYLIPVKDNTKTRLVKSGEYQLGFTKVDGTTGIQKLNDVTLLNFIVENEELTGFVVSNKLLVGTRLYSPKNRDITYFYINLKDTDFEQPLSNVLITPSELALV